MLAYVPADVALWPRMTGAEVLDLLARIGPGTDTAYRDELIQRFALDVSKPAGTYSTGNRQKLALIAAFATRAPLLVLDEPISGLDPLLELQFQQAVGVARDNGQTAFLSSHQLAEGASWWPGRDRCVRGYVRPGGGRLPQRGAGSGGLGGAGPQPGDPHPVR
nr:ATP-binding cassette domain-containing protein [Micromonospora sp. M71_S20]